MIFMTSETDKSAQNGRELETAQSNLFKVYLSQLGLVYDRLQPEQRISFLCELEGIIVNLKSRTTSDGTLEELLDFPIDLDSFDRERASTIREMCNLTPTELGQHLGLPQGIIHRYEYYGVPTPRKTERARMVHKYFNWLIANGYLTSESPPSPSS